MHAALFLVLSVWDVNRERGLQAFALFLLAGDAALFLVVSVCVMSTQICVLVLFVS